MTNHEQVNATIRYAMYSVFKVVSPIADADRAALAAEVRAVFDEAARQDDVVVRGTYDVGGMRADADLMVWWHAPSAEALQAAYHALRRTELGQHLVPVWSNVGVHRPSEFNREHVPAFLSGGEPGDWLCVYPFVRSYEWYLLSASERALLLREHGAAARDYGDIGANTIAAFALGDYEWLLAFEAAELHRIVDLMRELREVGARRHVREEVPFYTGKAASIEELVTRWA